MRAIAALLLIASAASGDEIVERVRATASRELAKQNAAYADAAKLPQTTLSVVPAVLGKINVWRFERFLPTRPLVFYVAVAADDHVWLLTGNPERFSQLATAAVPKTAVAAVEMARLFVETTRDNDQRHMLLASVDEIPFRPGIEGTAAQTRDQAKQMLASRIRPPYATHKPGGGWVVTAHAIDGDALVDLTLEIDDTGVHSHSKILRKDLPLAYAN